MQELRNLIEEYKSALDVSQTRVNTLEVKLSEMHIENEVALRRAMHAESEVFKTKKESQQHQNNMTYT